MLWHKIQGAGGLVGAGGGGGEVTFVDGQATSGFWSLTGVGANDCVILLQAKGGTSPDTTPTGFTLLEEHEGGYFWCAIYYAFGESSGSLTSNYGRVAAFTGTSPSSVPTSAALFTQTGSDPNPPSLSGFVSGDMVVAAAVHDGSTITAVPSGYTAIDGEDTDRTAMAYKSSGGGTEDPPSFTGNTSDEWDAFTVRIPAA